MRSRFRKRAAFLTLLCAAASLGFASVSCTMMQRGETVVKYTDPNQALMTDAPVTASYGLYASTDFDPMIVVALQRGERLGFLRKDDGALTAVAGHREIVIDAGDNHYWKQSP